MRRRDFLKASAAAAVAAATAYGAGLAAPARARADERKDLPRAPEGMRLKPPATGLIPVAFAISRSTTDIDWVGPEAVFETWHRDAAGKPAPRFKLFTVSDTVEPADGRVADYTFETVPSPAIVVVPAQSGSPALVEWLRKVSKTADVTMSVCVGARHLALAGLLDGRQATSHHSAIDGLAKQFPAVKWVRGVRFVEGEKISTGGGLTAGIDLALRVVERYFGREEARKVAEHLEYDGTRWMV